MLSPWSVITVASAGCNFYVLNGNAVFDMQTGDGLHTNTVAGFTWEITKACKPVTFVNNTCSTFYVVHNMLFLIYLTSFKWSAYIYNSVEKQLDFFFFHKESISYRSGSIHLCQIALFPVRTQIIERKTLLRIFGMFKSLKTMEAHSGHRIKNKKDFYCTFI